ncbi:MAG: hypothetical protein ACQEWL_18780 [Pseudomonadota bacterium]
MQTLESKIAALEQANAALQLQTGVLSGICIGLICVLFLVVYMQK